MHKAPPPEVSSEHYYESDPSKDYKRGFSIQTVSPLPITWAEHVAAQGHWGEVLRDYVHWSTLGAPCEFLPHYDNAVTLADETDRHGLPVASFAYSQSDNDTKLMRAAQTVMGEPPRSGRCRRGHDYRPLRPPRRRLPMATSPRHGVVDADQRSFAVPNLYLTDGSVLPTQGSANPALTIMALAARCADHLVTGARSGLRPRATTG